MIGIEFLQLFSNDGVYSVEVNFTNHDGSIASQKMYADEISRLIDPDTGNFFSEMRFDDWPGEITKYQIFPKSRKMKISVKLTKGD